MSSTTSATSAHTGTTSPTISVKPVTLAAPDRHQELQVRVSAPTAGRTDESPERVELIRQPTLAYLITAPGVDSGAWPAMRQALAEAGDPIGKIDSR